MSREILFKAKRLDNGEWVEGQYAYINNPLTENGEPIRHLICNGTNIFNYEIDRDTLCQYTGLTDKNGRKIWENDICKITSDTLDGYEYFICRYENKNARYVFECNNVTIEFGDIYPYEIEVVGNIFDNAYLLEVE